MHRRTPVHAAIAACSLACAVALSGCTTANPAAQAKRAPPCAFATCGTDKPSLAKATASAVGVELEQVAVTEAEPQFNGAVLVWRATVGTKTYACRQGRDPATGLVHYVTCQPSRDTGPLKAFP